MGLHEYRRKRNVKQTPEPSGKASSRRRGGERTFVIQPHWVKLELVAEVTFGEWTADGRMRHPSFQGLREDKPATAVVRELPVALANAGATLPRSTRWASGRPSGWPRSCSGTRKGAGTELRESSGMDVDAGP